jgi:hypothetical protein
VATVAPVTAAPGEAPGAQAPPQGAAPVDFVSTSRSMGWKVWVDGQLTCATPCRLWLTPGQWVTLKTRERRPVLKRLGAIGGQALRVEAKPLHTGAYATGITFTTLGGMAVVTGVTLGAVGCFSDRDGLCTAGKITGVSGALVLGGAIWLMRRALPKVRMYPLGGRGVTLYTTGNTAGAIAEF